jgi:predicted nucleotidyltransferase
MDSKIKLSKDKIAQFCQENHIIKLSLFGSILRNDFNESSDIDILVEFDKNHIPGFIRLANIQNTLSTLLGGKEVDLRTPNDLSPYIRDKVLSTAEVQYVQG